MPGPFLAQEVLVIARCAVHGCGKRGQGFIYVDLVWIPISTTTYGYALPPTLKVLIISGTFISRS